MSTFGWLRPTRQPDPPTSRPYIPEATPTDVYAHAAVERIDAALRMYQANRCLPQAALADALLDVRHRLVQGLTGGKA